MYKYSRREALTPLLTCLLGVGVIFYGIRYIFAVRDHEKEGHCPGGYSECMFYSKG